MTTTYRRYLKFRSSSSNNLKDARNVIYSDIELTWTPCISYFPSVF